ncbi:hypothetical protein ACIQC9_08970 [Brevundimonas sp. NPDC092305]|uniref:hypothetical protein n=1 Tax=Brevundimonas sp. NPDC092305 TaxID=3363957 RepID=UPI003804DA2D
MSTALIVLGLLIVAAVVVYFATRKKTAAPAERVLPQDGDTGWNDPVTPGQPARTDLPNKD